MRDHGKAQEFMTRTGRAFARPERVPARVPTTPCVPVTEWEWQACMAEIGFEWVDDGRWCATVPPHEGTFGWCVIVVAEDADVCGDTPAGFGIHMTIDTVDNEQDSPWVYPDRWFETPLEAARAGLAMVAGLGGTP